MARMLVFCKTAFGINLVKRNPEIKAAYPGKMLWHSRLEDTKAV